jgi:hypothetical protein
MRESVIDAVDKKVSGLFFGLNLKGQAATAKRWNEKES